MANLSRYAAIRLFITSDDKIISIFRSAYSGNLTDRWVVYGSGVEKSAYVNKRIVAKTILAYRQPGQITGLSTIDLLVNGW